MFHVPNCFVRGAAALVFIAAALTGCADQPTRPTLQGAPADKPEFGTWGVETQYITPAIKPGDDFYRYVNQGWLDTAQIPPGWPLGGAFVNLMLRSEQRVQAIVDEQKTKQAAPGTPAQQIADLHASYVDMTRRNARGAGMLQDEVGAILKATDHHDLARRMGSLSYPSLVSAEAVIDPDKTSHYVLRLEQSGLGLPGRDYYLKPEAPYQALRQAYASYIEGAFTRAGVPDAKTKAAAVLTFETALASKHLPPEQTRDPVRNHHPMTLAALTAYAPGFDWQAFFSTAGLGDLPQVDVATDAAIKGEAEVFGAAPIDTLRAYVAFHYLNRHAPLLSDDWVNAHFDLFSRQLAGIQEQRPLQARATNYVNAVLGEPVGKLYVERYFTPDAKAEADKLVKFLRLAFRERLAQNDWMDEATRAQAIAKLDAITAKIGYPSQRHDYSDLVIAKDDLVGNSHRYQEWLRRDLQAKLKAPVRRWEWGMNPQEINAYFYANGAEIVFPAAILQAPFFDPKADPAVNFGAIGMVIGHEMGHGFDDQGSRFDGTGALRNWWSPASQKNFEQRTSRLVAQYNQYSPLPGLHVNGSLTLGENIGDLGGISIAYSGYQKYVAAEYGGKAPVIDGLSGNQRFFLGYAQLWRTVVAEGFLRQATLTNAHSPDEFRVNGVVRNFTPWYDAFNVKPGDALYLAPADRISIW